MKIRADRAELAEALTWVALAISKRPVNPALGGIRLTAADDVLTLHAFDYETSHAAQVDVEVQSDGECLVAGHFLREIVSALKGEHVELVLDDSRLSITSGRSTYRVAVLRMDDYPGLPEFPTHVGRVAYDDLTDIVGTVEHAASRNDSLAILTSVRLVGAVGTLSAAATDRYRIARAETLWSIDRPDGEPGAFTANVPVRVLTSALKGMSGAIEIGCDGGAFGLADARRSVTVRCMPDEFPKIDRILTLDHQVTLEVDATDLADAVKRAAMAAGEHDQVHLHIAEGEISVTADSESGEGAEFVECQASAPVEVVFNGRYLVDALTATTSTRVQMRFSGQPQETKPVTIAPLDHERVDLLVMPRRNT